MRLLALASLFAGLLAVAVPAQARKPLLGTVADSRGAPLAGFDVECVLAPEGPAAPAVEILRAKTDARGRFRVDALQCAYYRCWAAGPAMDDGARLVSDEQPIAVGQIVTLTVRARAKAGCSLRGLEAWQERAPFVLRQSVAGQVVEFPVEAVDDGFVARLGPRPSGERMAHLVDRDGFTVFVTSLTTMATHANVPAAQTLRCRVVDADGKPVAGARIVRVGSAARVDYVVSSAKIRLAPAYRDPVQAFACGVTGEDGVAVVALAHRSKLLGANADFGDRTVLLRAEAPGKAAAYGGRCDDMLFEDGCEVERKEDRDGFVFTLKPVAPVSGRLVDGARPLPGVSMRLTFKTPLKTKAGWARDWVDERHAVTDAEGRFRFEGVPPTATELSLACAVSADRPAGDAGAVLATRPVLPARLGDRAELKQDVVVDLATFRTVVLTVRDDTGGPGRVLQLAVAPADADWGDLQCMTLLAPDATGRVAVLLAPGACIVAACSQDGFALQEVAAGAKSAELAIAPFPSMCARVVDAEGKPVAGATFKTGGTHWRGGQENGVARMTQWLASEWNQTLLARGKSDDAGVLRLSLLPAPGYAVAGRIVQREMKSAELQAAAEDVGDVVVK